MAKKGNTDNLIKNEDLTPEERRENARKAGEASGKARAKNASIRKILLDSFHNATVAKDKDGKDITGAEFTAMQIVAGIKKGNMKMLELYLAMVGEKPDPKGANVEITVPIFIGENNLED